MDSIFTYAAIFIISTITLIFGAEFFGYVIADYKLKEINEDAIELIENHGGYTQEVKNKIEMWITQNNLDIYNVRVTESPSATLQWQEDFTFKLEGEYLYKTINLLGTGIGNAKKNLSSSGNGSSHVYPHS